MRKYDIIYPNVNYTNLNINTNINTNINNIIEIYKIKNNNIFNYLSSDKYLYNNNELILDEKNYIYPVIILYCIVYIIYNENKEVSYTLKISNKKIYDLVINKINKIILINKISIIKMLYLNNNNLFIYKTTKKINELTIKDYIGLYTNQYKINTNNQKEIDNNIKKIICGIYKINDDHLDVEPKNNLIINIKDISRFKEIIIKEKDIIYIDLKLINKTKHYIWYGFPQNYFKNGSDNLIKYYITNNEIKLFLLDDDLLKYYNTVINIIIEKINKNKDNNILFIHFNGNITIDYIKFMSHILIFYKNCKKINNIFKENDELLNKYNKLEIYLKTILLYIYIKLK